MGFYYCFEFVRIFVDICQDVICVQILYNFVKTFIFGKVRIEIFLISVLIKVDEIHVIF